MSNLVFLFDLDSTLTKKEILPLIARECGIYEEMNRITESTMRGELPFKQSFLKRVDLLKSTPVSKVRELISRIDLNTKIIDFIQNNKERCFIVTGNLDVWIEQLLLNIGMEKNIFCSKAVVKNDLIQNVFSVIDKNAVISQMVSPFVAVGDGNNDAEMIEAAEVGIGFGGVHDIAPSVLACASHAVYDENKLVDLLNKLL
jgi:HAD superfamily phosphoserine phosphatase-like hydrolase